MENSVTVPLKPELEPRQLALGGSTLAPVLWIIYYRRGDNPGFMWEMFYHSGTLVEVIARGKTYCTTMSYRFIKVVPAISNLTEKEKEHTNSY